MSQTPSVSSMSQAPKAPPSPMHEVRQDRREVEGASLPADSYQPTAGIGPKSGSVQAASVPASPAAPVAPNAPKSAAPSPAASAEQAPGPASAASRASAPVVTPDGWNLVGVPATASLPASVPAAPTAPVQPRGFDSGNLDKTTPPRKDFYQHAVGTYLANHPIPPDRTSWGVDGVLVQEIQGKLRGILEQCSASSQAGALARGSNEQKIGDFYRSGMDTATIEAAGLRPLQGELERISSIRTLVDFQDEVARLHGKGIGCLFGFGGGQDASDAEQVIAQAWQGGLGLPERDYYFKDDPASQKIRDAYVDHVARTFELMGDHPAVAKAEAVSVMALETRLAAASWNNVEIRDPHATYNPKSREELAALTPSFDWGRYFKGLGLSEEAVKKTNVGTPSFFEKLDGLLTEVPLDSWKTYLRWQLVAQASPYLSSPFEQEDFNFDRVLTGVEQQPPRWKRVVKTTDNYLGEALGQKFVEQNFSGEAKVKALELVENIKTATREKIHANTWMSESTRQAALEKVDTLVAKIGYPDKWKDYSSLEVDGGVYVDNVMRAKEFASRQDLATIGRPVDHGKWQMTPSTVNAYYDPAMNEIVFPAAILQPPYFDPKADAAVNYGATGATIGHELTHAFDDSGSQYDARGNMRNWWQPEDLERFKQLANGTVRQYDEFEFDGQKCNGELVQGEALADLGGLELSYAAYKHATAGEPQGPGEDGFTPDQRFFLNYALSWASNTRPEEAHLQMSTDPHPLNKFRVNGPLSNLPAFFEAFDVQPGDPMMRPEDKRNALWNA